MAPLLHAAELRSRELGVGADRVLIQWGVIDEAAYLRRLSRHTGIAFDPHQQFARAAIPLPDDQLVHPAQHGMLPLAVEPQEVVLG